MAGGRAPGISCIATRTVRTCAGSTTTTRMKSPYPDWRTVTSCLPGNNSTFLSPLSSLTYPTYTPSTQTPASLSTPEAPLNFSSPITLLSCAAERGGASKMENRARRRAAEGNRKLLYMKPPISGRGVYSNPEDLLIPWLKHLCHGYSFARLLTLRPHRAHRSLTDLALSISAISAT